MNEEIIMIIEEAMDLDEGSLELDSCLSDYEEWDSLATLSLVVNVRKKYGKSITTAQLLEFKTVKDICDCILG